MVSEQPLTCAAVEHRVRSVYRRLRLNRVRAALGCVSSAGLDGHWLENGGSEVEEALNTASAAADQLAMLANLDGSEVPIRDDLPLCPEGKAFARINKNMMPPSNFRQKFFVPYLGEEDSHVEQSSKLADDLDDKKPDEDAKEDIEKVLEELKKSSVAEMISPYLTDQMDDSDVEELSQSLAVPSLIPSRTKWERSAKRVAIFECVRYFGFEKRHEVVTQLSQVLSLSSKTVYRYLANALYRSFAWDLHDQDEKLNREHKASLVKWIRREKRTRTKALLESDSIPYFACRQCKVFDCTVHGSNTLKDPETGISLDFAVAFDGSRKDSASIRFNQQDKCKKIEKSCSFASTPKCACYIPNPRDECMEVDTGSNHLDFKPTAWNGNTLTNGHLNGNNNRGDISTSQGFRQGEVVNLLSDDDDDDDDSVDSRETDLISRETETARDLRSFIDMFCPVFGNDPCRLTQVVNSVNIFGEIVSCVSIGNYIKSIPQEKLAKPVIPKRKQARTKSRFFMSKKEEAAMEQGFRFHYSPCQHEGLCTSKNCSCIQKGIACEKYCRCLIPRVSGDTTHEGLRCANSFSYCACKTGCKITSCNCVGGKRECDPDWCKCSCSPKVPCQNQGLRRRDTVRVACGHSDIQGWGAYATRPIEKDELIGEYTGEYLDATESDNKEKVYNAQQTSYLFGLTEERDVDATRIGNKLRFINHSRNANCIPKMKRVDGDIRVGLYATRHIQAFEELLFNYGSAFASLLDSPGNRRGKKRRAIAVPSASGSNSRVPMEVDVNDQ